MKLDKYDIAMVNAGCKTDEPARPMLQCLNLTKGRIEVANGFIMATRDLELEDGEAKPETLLPISMVKQIKAGGKQQAILKTDNQVSTVTYQDEMGKQTEFEPEYSFKSLSNSKSFPDTTQIFPKDTTKKAHICVLVRELRSILNILPNNGFLRIGITEPDKALEFECDHMDRPIRGLIMPMFVDWKDFKWHREEASK